MNESFALAVLAAVLGVVAIPSPMIFGIPFLVGSIVLAIYSLFSKAKATRILSGITLGWDVLVFVILMLAVAAIY